MTQFSGSALKLQRARHHYDSLVEVLKRFAASKPYGFYTEPYPKPPTYVLRVRVNQTVPSDCGLIVGDFAHNARSALDLLVYDLSTLAAKDKKRRKLQFPIFDDEAKYMKYRDSYLLGVCERDRKMIEEFLPYQSSGQKAGEALGILAKINNMDKHRLIPVVAAFGHLNSLADSRGIEFSADAQFSMTGSPNDEFGYTGVGDGVLTDGAILAELKIGPSACCDLQPHVSALIQFGGEGVEVAGRDLMPTLASILNRTEEIVKQFRGV